MDKKLAFSHIPKTGGTTMERILRQSFGFRHATVIYKNVGNGVLYSASDLRRDLRIYPWLRSLSGHALKAYSDLDNTGLEFSWYTFLRKPVSRYLSLYQHQYTRGKEAYRGLSFEEWTRIYGRERRNQMVKWIAGVEDLEAAKQLLDDRFAFVGIMEHYDVSLYMLKRALGVPEMNIAYNKPSNRAPTDDVRKRILATFDRYSEMIEEHNFLDIELYKYAVDTIWPRQLREHGEGSLDERARQNVRGRIGAANRMRYLQNRVYRNLVYKPAVRHSK